MADRSPWEAPPGYPSQDAAFNSPFQGPPYQTDYPPAVGNFQGPAATGYQRYYVPNPVFPPYHSGPQSSDLLANNYLQLANQLSLREQRNLLGPYAPHPYQYYPPAPPPGYLTFPSTTPPLHVGGPTPAVPKESAYGVGPFVGSYAPSAPSPAPPSVLPSPQDVDLERFRKELLQQQRQLLREQRELLGPYALHPSQHDLRPAPPAQPPEYPTFPSTNPPMNVGPTPAAPEGSADRTLMGPFIGAYGPSAFFPAPPRALPSPEQVELGERKRGRQLFEHPTEQSEEIMVARSSRIMRSGPRNNGDGHP